MESFPPLRPGQRIDALDLMGLHIIQDPSCFCFGTDAVLLAHFTRAKSHQRILDLGTGNGILPLLLYGLYQPKHITGIEIQPHMVQMAQHSVALNHLQERISIVWGDYRNPALLGAIGPFQLVVANPPYHPVGTGDCPETKSEHIARFEIAATLRDVIHAAGAVLQQGGRFCLVHQPRRLGEIMALCTQYRLTPKRMRMVQPTVHKPPTLILLEAIKDAKPGMRVGPVLIVHAPDGSVTHQMQEIYRGGLIE